MPAAVAPMGSAREPKRFKSREVVGTATASASPAHLPSLLPPLSNNRGEEEERHETIAPLPTALKTRASRTTASETRPGSAGANRAVSEDGIRLRRDSTISMASIAGVSADGASSSMEGVPGQFWSGVGANGNAGKRGEGPKPLSRKEARKKQKETEKQLRGIPLINIPRWYMDEAFYYMLNVSIVKFLVIFWLVYVFGKEKREKKKEVVVQLAANLSFRRSFRLSSHLYPTPRLPPHISALARLHAFTRGISHQPELTPLCPSFNLFPGRTVQIRCYHSNIWDAFRCNPWGIRDAR